MNIIVVGRHQQVNAAMKEYARRKAGKLGKYFDRVHRIEVIMDVVGDDYRAEMVATASRGHRFVASAAESDMFASIDRVCEKMENQITRYKEKVRGKRASSRRVPRSLYS